LIDDMMHVSNCPTTSKHRLLHHVALQIVFQTLLNCNYVLLISLYVLNNDSAVFHKVTSTKCNPVHVG